MSSTGPVGEIRALSSETKRKLERLLQSDQESKLFYRMQGKEESQRKQGRVRRTARRLRRALARRRPRVSVRFLRKKASQADEAAEKIWDEVSGTPALNPVQGRLKVPRHMLDAAKAAAETSVRRTINEERDRLRSEQRTHRRKKGGSNKQQCARTRRRKQRYHRKRRSS